MAVWLPVDSLSPTDCGAIAQYLSVELGKDNFLKRKYNKAKTFLTAFGIGEDGLIRLPFMYAKLFLLKQTAVRQSQRQYATCPLQFAGSYQPHQPSIVQEALDGLAKWHTCTLNVYTGAGKTVMAAAISTYLPVLRLVLIHPNHLTRNWQGAFAQCVRPDGTAARIWAVDEKGHLPKEPPDVIICMNTRLHLIPAQWLPLIGTLIIDEAHQFCAPKFFLDVLKIEPMYVMALTATTNKSDGSYEAMNAVTGAASLVRRKLDKPFTIIKYLTGFTPPPTFNVKGETNWTELVNVLDGNEERKRRLVAHVLRNTHMKTLVVTRTVEACRELAKLIGVHQKTSSFCEGDKDYEDAPVLVATMSKIRDGFDEQYLARNFGGKRLNFLILWVSVKEPLALEQIVGRVFRAADPYIVYMVDSNKVIERHWSECKKWFLEHKANMLEHREAPYQCI